MGAPRSLLQQSAAPNPTCSILTLLSAQQYYTEDTVALPLDWFSKISIIWYDNYSSIVVLVQSHELPWLRTTAVYKYIIKYEIWCHDTCARYTCSADMLQCTGVVLFTPRPARRVPVRLYQYFTLRAHTTAPSLLYFLLCISSKGQYERLSRVVIYSIYIIKWLVVLGRQTFACDQRFEPSDFFFIIFSSLLMF